MATAQPPTPPIMDLPALRQRILDQVILAFGALFTLSGGLALARHLTIAWNPLVLLNLSLVPLIWLLILVRRRISYQWKVGLLVLMLWCLATNSMVMVGPVANSKGLFSLIVLVSMLFMSARAGWLNVAVGVLILSAIGAAAVAGLIHFDIDYPRYVKTPMVWVQTVVTFTIFCALTAHIAAWLVHALNDTVQTLDARTKVLHQTQEQLQATLNRQRAILNNSSAGIALIDGAGNILEANPHFCELVGYGSEEIGGQSLWLIQGDHAADEASAPFMGLGADGADVEIRRCDGSLLWTHASRSALDPAAPQADAVLVLVDIDQRKRAELDLALANVELHRLATTDTLTGVWNRRHFERRVTFETARRDRCAASLALIMLDIDRFKSINDRYGHPTGDLVLVEMTRLIRRHLRTNDLLARWGGEEFVIMLPDCTATNAMNVAEKLRALVADWSFPDVGTVTASFGVAALRPDEAPADWLKRADDALYTAKSLGGNVVR